MLQGFLIKSIKLYQKYISRLRKRSCVFYPTCSEYGIQAVGKYGSVKGVLLIIRRLLRCHPFQTPRIDHLP